jgi:4-hydroxy-tetrahydrodipicolinate synthase
MKPEGIFVPNITPFTNKDEVNFIALEALIEFWISSGVSGIVANASTGEAPYLSIEEKKQILEFIIEKVDSRIHVYAGTGAMSTKETINLTKDAKEAGAEIALVTTPFFFKPSNNGIKQHYIDLMDSVDIPVILYNVPKFTGYSINPIVVSEIVDECDGLVAIKDSSGNPGLMAEVIRLCGNKLNALSGSADMILPTLMLGGKGAIVAIGNVIPDSCFDLYNAYKNNDLITASRLQGKASYVNKILVRDNPQIAAIKAYLNHLGFDAGNPRKPLQSLNDNIKTNIISSLKNIQTTS